MHPRLKLPLGAQRVLENSQLVKRIKENGLDPESYLSLAKAYHFQLLQGDLDSKKALIDRKILDLCQQVQRLDVREEHGHDLEEFKKKL